jgi:hypothetical protein
MPPGWGFLFVGGGVLRGALVGTALAARRADELVFEIGQP